MGCGNLGALALIWLPEAIGFGGAPAPLPAPASLRKKLTVGSRGPHLVEAWRHARAIDSGHYDFSNLRPRLMEFDALDVENDDGTSGQVICEDRRASEVQRDLITARCRFCCDLGYVRGRTERNAYSLTPACLR